MEIVLALIKALLGLLRRLFGAITARAAGKLLVALVVAAGLAQLNQFLVRNWMPVIIGIISVIVLPSAVWAVVWAAGMADRAIAGDPKRLKRLQERRRWQHLL